MNTESVNGLLLQKATSPPPAQGEERFLSWEQKQGKSGKPYFRVKNQSQEYGGTLCGILRVERTDFVDSHGNVSFNVEFQPKNNGGRLETANPTMLGRAGGPPSAGFDPIPQDAKGAALPGVDEAKRHIMQAVNLYNLCVDAVDTCIKPHINNCTAELYQAAIASIWIEAKDRRSRDGKTWWSYVDRMPTHKIK